ncbi:MAG: HIT domain-containing protein [Deltaproteobacteria bacterium]|nr:HIT domain-containing protein [Deltaproteobacteria bacterium]
MDCIFCKIVHGDIPCVRVFEDERVLAFMDINPINEGHVLVIPKAHAATILEIEAADFAAVAAATHKIAAAVQEALHPDGINLLQLNGKAANQVVPHLHVHIVPRWFKDGVTISQWEIVPGDMNRIKDVADRIQKALQ